MNKKYLTPVVNTSFTNERVYVPFDRAIELLSKFINCVCIYLGVGEHNWDFL